MTEANCDLCGELNKVKIIEDDNTVCKSCYDMLRNWNEDMVGWEEIAEQG